MKSDKSPIPSAESLTVEFKSDRKRLPDDELVQALVGLANTQGGDLWLGVEDDGTPTGLHQKHLDLQGLPALVQARTSPPLTVDACAVENGGVTVARISVKKSRTDVATTAGVYLRRRLKHDGTPECVPLLPHERSSRASHFGLMPRHSRLPGQRWRILTRWNVNACDKACSVMAVTVYCWN